MQSANGFRLVVLPIVALALTLQFISALEESATNDEPAYLAAGYSYWKTGDFRLNAEHPPVSKLVIAIPLLLLKPDFSPSRAYWRSSDEYALGKEFLYKNTIPADTMLAAARGTSMLVCLLLTLSLASWVGRVGGPVAGIAA